MKQVEACHRYQSCSVNNCPLADEEHFSDEADNEIRCPLPKDDIEKIKERYVRIQNNPVIIPEPDPILISDRMKDENNSLFRMTPEQTKKVNALIRSECCNYESGKCKLLMDDHISMCPQISAPSVLCAWCRVAIIPLNRELEAEIFQGAESKEKKRCAACNKLFVPKTNRQKFCSKCATIEQKKRKAENQRKRRSMKPVRANL